MRAKTGVAIGNVNSDADNEVICVGHTDTIFVYAAQGTGGSGAIVKALEIDTPEGWSPHGKVACGDIDGDGVDEIAIPAAYKYGVLAYDSSGSFKYSTYNPDNDTTRIYRSNCVALANLDADSDLEVLTGGSSDYGVFGAFDPDGDSLMALMWRYRSFDDPNQRWVYTSTRPAAADLNGDDTSEVYGLTWVDSNSAYPRVNESVLKVMHPTDGDTIKYIDPGFGFSAIAVQEGDSSDFLFLSSDFDDPDHRVFMFGRVGETTSELGDSLESLISAISREDLPVDSALVALRSSVDTLSIRTKKSSRKYSVLLDRSLLQYNWQTGTPPTYDYRKALLDSFTTANVEGIMVWSGYYEEHDSLFPRIGKEMARDTILARTAELEEDTIPFMIEFSHAETQFFSVDCCSLIAEQCSTTFKGVVFLENYTSGYWQEECSGGTCWRKLIDTMRVLVPMCERMGLKVVLCDKAFRTLYSDTVDSSGYNWLLDTAYADVVVPMLKLNRNSHVDEELAMLIGLWKSGYVSDFGYSTQQDNWNWDQTCPAGLVPADRILRMEMSAIALGATYLRVEGAQPYFTRYGQILQDTVTWERNTRYHRGLVYGLMKKNVVEPMDTGSLVNVSRVGFLHTQDELHELAPWQVEDRQAHWLFGRGHELMDVPPYSVSSFLSGAQAHAEAVYPNTKYGLYTIVPEADTADGIIQRTCADSLIRTDGIRAEIGGSWDSAWVVDGPIEAAFDSAADSLPFVCDSCFMAVHELDSVYRLYMMDTDYFQTTDDTCTVTVRTATLAAGETSGRDIITGETFAISSSQMSIPIPAGLFRIVELDKALE